MWVIVGEQVIGAFLSEQEVKAYWDRWEWSESDYIAEVQKPLYEKVQVKKETTITFSFEGKEFVAPLEEAREICYMQDGVIELPDGRIVYLTVYAVPVSPGYIVHEVALYNRESDMNSENRVKAQEK